MLFFIGFASFHTLSVFVLHAINNITDELVLQYLCTCSPRTSVYNANLRTSVNYIQVYPMFECII